MPQASVPEDRSMPARAHLLFIALLSLGLLIAGCREEARQVPPTPAIDGSHVSLTAYLDAASPCQQKTIDLLRNLEADHPARLDVTVVDISTREGWHRWQQAQFDAVALVIDDSTTVSWGSGDSRRTVSFEHPAGFAWTHEDLRAAVKAAVSGRLATANPAEAEGVRLMDVTARGQSIRVGDNGSETGQLVIRDEIAIQLSHPRGQLAPGQRVNIAAETLNEVLAKAFTPNQLTLAQVEEGVALMAADQQLLLATDTDVNQEYNSPWDVAEHWRRAVREALCEAALHRSDAAQDAAEPSPPEPAATPADELAEPLQPAE